MPSGCILLVRSITSLLRIASWGVEVGRGQAIEIPHRVEGGLLFKAIDARAGVQDQFGDEMIGRRRRARHAHVRKWIRRNGLRLERDAESTSRSPAQRKGMLGGAGLGNVDDYAKILAVVAGFQGLAAVAAGRKKDVRRDSSCRPQW